MHLQLQPKIKRENAAETKPNVTLKGVFKPGPNMPQKMKIVETCQNQTKAGPKLVKVLPTIAVKGKKRKCAQGYVLPPPTKGC